MSTKNADYSSILKNYLSKEDDAPVRFLSLGYLPLNEVISGSVDRGLAYGRIYEIAGPSASGKTLLATQAMIAAQQKGGVAIFVDWERTFNAEFAESLGLDCSIGRFILLRSETWEEGNANAMKIAAALREQGNMPPEAPIVVIFDSIAAAVPKSMVYDSKNKPKEIADYTMNDTTALARVTSTTLKVINQYVAKFNVVAIYLNQIRVKPGVVYGDPTVTPGGSSMEFYATTRMFTARTAEWGKDEDGDKVMNAAEIRVTTKKNKLAQPFQTTRFQLSYNKEGLARIDFPTCYINELIDMGKLKAAHGQRVEWEGKSPYRTELALTLNTPEGIKKLEDLYREAVADKG